MKKILAIIVILLTSFTFTACGFKDLSSIERYSDLSFEGITKVTCTYYIEGKAKDVEVTGEEAEEVITLLKAVTVKKVSKQDIIGDTWKVTLHYADESTQTFGFFAGMVTDYGQFYKTENINDLREKIMEIVYAVYDEQGNQRE